MPSPFAEALAERLLDRYPPDRAYDRATLDETSSGKKGLPRTVRHFLKRMMARRVEIEREHLRVLQQPWLDYEHEEVRQAEEALLAAVRRHVRIPAAAWERVLRHACERVATYLVRPVPALEDFVFGTGAPDSPADSAGDEEEPDTLSADVVLRRLGYFAAYPYLREATSAYVEQRDVSAFQRPHLVALLRRVDEKMCADHDTEGWLRLLQPLFALAQTAYPNHDGVPVALLEEFFQEKKADLPLQHLRAARREHDIKVLSPSALAEVIAPVSSEPDVQESPSGSSSSEELASPEEPASSSGRTASPEEAGSASREESSPEARTPDATPSNATPSAPERASRQGTPAAPDDRPTASSAPGSTDADDHETSSEEDDQALPLWKRFLGVSAPEEKPEAGAAPPSRASVEEENEPRPRWQQFSVVSEEEPRGHTERPDAAGSSSSNTTSKTNGAASSQAPSAPPETKASEKRALRPLEEEVLGHAADNRTLFVRELFGGSREDYEQVLRRLRDVEDWQTATQIIARDVFRTHQVNIYSDPARSFTNAVEAQFR